MSNQNLAKLTRNGVYLTIVRDVYELEVVFASYNYVQKLIKRNKMI